MYECHQHFTSAYMLSNPTTWIDSDIETCCDNYYDWAKDACVSASVEAAGSSAPVSSPATTACVGECYTFDSQDGKMTVTYPDVNGGCNFNAMCVTTLELLTSGPTGSPTTSHSPSRSPSKEVSIQTHILMTNVSN